MEDLDQQIKMLEFEIAKEQLRAVRYETQHAMHRLRPSHNYPITIKRDGSRWLCLLETSPVFLECPMAYGDSPNQALLNFDHLWLGTGQYVEAPEDDGEEYPFYDSEEF